MLLLFVFCFAMISGQGQGSFVDFQKSFVRVSQAFSNKEDTLQKQFRAKKLDWPMKYMYVRSFKFNSELEVWVKNKLTDTFTMFKKYRICALAGTMGPKRMEGDYQVPEGFYYINEFNPNSSYYLSLGLNYPNPADKLLADSMHPGSDIYIHGSCVTVGCIPIMDSQIEELYVLATFARSAGQDFIPVHIFPARYRDKNSAEYMEKFYEVSPEVKPFELNLRRLYDFFEDHKKLPVVAVDKEGNYVFY